MDFENLHQILRSLYDEMMPLCEDMAGVAKGIAGLGALFYVAYRVWQSLARAEPIDVFPMLRPFAIGLCIMFFPTVVLGTLSGVLSPIVQGTAQMLEAETLDMNRRTSERRAELVRAIPSEEEEAEGNEYREQKDKLEYEAMKRNPPYAEQLQHAVPWGISSKRNWTGRRRRKSRRLRNSSHATAKGITPERAYSLSD